MYHDQISINVYLAMQDMMGGRLFCNQLYLAIMQLCSFSAEDWVKKPFCYPPDDVVLLIADLGDMFA